MGHTTAVDGDPDPPLPHTRDTALLCSPSHDGNQI